MNYSIFDILIIILKIVVIIRDNDNHQNWYIKYKMKQRSFFTL